MQGTPPAAQQQPSTRVQQIADDIKAKADKRDRVLKLALQQGIKNRSAQLTFEQLHSMLHDEKDVNGNPLITENDFAELTAQLVGDNPRTRDINNVIKALSKADAQDKAKAEQAAALAGEPAPDKPKGKGPQKKTEGKPAEEPAAQPVQVSDNNAENAKKRQDILNIAVQKGITNKEAQLMFEQLHSAFHDEIDFNGMSLIDAHEYEQMASKLAGDDPDIGNVKNKIKFVRKFDASIRAEDEAAGKPAKPTRRTPEKKIKRKPV